MEQRSQKQIPTGIQRIQLSTALVVWETISVVEMVPAWLTRGPHISRTNPQRRIARIMVEHPRPATADIVGLPPECR